MNPQLKRIVLLSQYYPALTEFTPYFIYTGFSHLTRAEQKGQSPFTAVEETMNELYREILNYAATKDKEIVFADVTSSLNPLATVTSRNCCTDYQKNKFNQWITFRSINSRIFQALEMG